MLVMVVHGRGNWSIRRKPWMRDHNSIMLVLVYKVLPSFCLLETKHPCILALSKYKLYRNKKKKNLHSTEKTLTIVNNS